MTNEAAIDQIKRELDDALDTMRSDLDRVEMLAAALNAFSHPIPDYEPRFLHLNHATLRHAGIGARGRQAITTIRPAIPAAGVPTHRNNAAAHAPR